MDLHGVCLGRAPGQGLLPRGQSDASCSRLLSNGDGFSRHRGDGGVTRTCVSPRGALCMEVQRQRTWLLPLGAQGPPPVPRAGRGGRGTVDSPPLSLSCHVGEQFWPRIVPTERASESGYKQLFCKRAKLKKIVLKSITVIEMRRLKYFVTVCGNLLSRIMKEGPWGRVFKGDLKNRP